MWVRRLLGGEKDFPKKEVRDKMDGGGDKIHTGDLVKIKSAQNIAGFSKFMGPFEVSKVYEHYVILNNGQKWNRRRVALYSKGVKNSKAGELMQSSDGYIYLSELDNVQNNSQSNVHPVQSRNEGSGDGGEIAADVGDMEHVRQNPELPRIRREYRRPDYLKDYIM